MMCPICGAYATPCRDTGYDADEPCSDRCEAIAESEEESEGTNLEKETT